VLTPWITQLLGLYDGDANTERVASAFYPLPPIHHRTRVLAPVVSDAGNSRSREKPWLLGIGNSRSNHGKAVVVAEFACRPDL
tara:strand:+ start:33498 stop:33746 length:249 start_codon:yes stop_codon:yes gene_type:complete